MREAVRAASRIAAPLSLAAFVSGCSFAVPGLPADQVEATGSIGRSGTSTLSADLGQEDWRRAKGSLAIALDPQGSGAGVKWDNPDSGVSGLFTPVAAPYVKSNEICRAFLATIAFPGRSTTLQGTACKVSADDWEIREAKPWRKPD